MSRFEGQPRPYRGALAEIIRGLSCCYLAADGWKIRGDWPALKKAVLIAAPHTSNWDGLNMLAAASYYRISLKWMGKESLTRGPFGWLIRALGCVPVDRSARNNLVQAMTAAFSACEEMILAVPPEGTRSLAREWKSGFYHIARGAQVPLILSVLDYGTKTIQIAGVFHPTGDYDSDLVRIQAYYRNAVGKHRAKFAAGT